MRNQFAIIQPKRCAKCKVTKYPRGFGKNKLNHDGLQHACYLCMNKLKRLETFVPEISIKFKAEKIRRINV